jgi:predicted ATP-grasp superfamily ATP-dependent carboligase
LRIAVYEHFSAMGAFYSPAWIEGDAMLKAVVEDLRRAGHEVQVADSIPPKRPADLVVVIAPSTGRTLYNLVKSCEEEGLDVVDSPSTAVFVATDKALLYKNLEAHGVRTPKTLISRYEEGLKAIERALAAFGKVVVKPADGNGCAGLSIVSRPEEAPIALSNAKQSSRLPYFLAQEYVEGENLSVCLLGESIPGGTTTALGILVALGYDAWGKVSSASPSNPHRLKEVVVREGLERSGLRVDEARHDPLRAVSALGDPVHVSMAWLPRRSAEEQGQGGAGWRHSDVLRPSDSQAHERRAERRDSSDH